MPASSRTSQGQSGSDSTLSQRDPTITESTRTMPEQVSETVSSPSTQTTVQTGGSTRRKSLHSVGFKLSFTIKVSNNLPALQT